MSNWVNPTTTSDPQKVAPASQPKSRPPKGCTGLTAKKPTPKRSHRPHSQKADPQKVAPASKPKRRPPKGRTGLTAKKSAPKRSHRPPSQKAGPQKVAPPSHGPSSSVVSITTALTLQRKHLGSRPNLPITSSSVVSVTTTLTMQRKHQGLRLQSRDNSECPQQHPRRPLRRTHTKGTLTLGEGWGA